MDSNSLMKTAIRLRARLWVLRMVNFVTLTRIQGMLLQTALPKVITQVIGTISEQMELLWQVFKRLVNKHFTLTKMASKSRVKSWHFQIRVSVTLMPTQEKWQSASLQKVPRTNGITLTKLEKQWQVFKRLANKHFTLTKMASKSRGK